MNDATEGNRHLCCLVVVVLGVLEISGTGVLQRFSLAATSEGLSAAGKGV